MNNTFSGQTFMEKEAANPKGVFKFLKRKKETTKPPSKNGTFVNSVSDSKVDPSNARFFNEEELRQVARDADISRGTGSLAVDGALGITKKVAPKSKAPIEGAVNKVKDKTEAIDTAIGARLAGNDPSSFRGKLFSSKVSRPVGEVPNTSGNTSQLLREDRRPSLVAPVSNTAKATTPFLAAMYLGEKLYPIEGDNVNQTPHETNFQKVSFVEENKNVFDQSIIERMDKVASMQKISTLEETISKYASQLEASEMEKVAMERKLEETMKEKVELEKKASVVQNNLMEKQAEYEEFRLRTIAQKRSKVAVDLSDELLENGIIKQAQVQKTIDKLMECDEDTIKMYQSLIKEAENKEESLESLSILGEYRSNDKLANFSKDGAQLGLSKKGQSIGEAARDLNTK